MIERFLCLQDMLEIFILSKTEDVEWPDIPVLHAVTTRLLHVTKYVQYKYSPFMQDRKY